MTLKNTGYAEASVIRSLMKQVLPGRKAIFPQEIYNVCIRAKMLMKDLQSKGQLLKHFIFKPDVTKELFTPLDELTDDIADVAVEAAREVYFSYLNDGNCSFKLFGYLGKLASMDSGFTYNISTDTDGNMTGFCWMTSVMRSHFEKFNVCLFLDAMRRKTNVHLWPYMAVVIVNEMGEAHPVCESIIMSEVEQAYVFLVKSALEMAPNVDPNNIRVVFGDQFFTPPLIQLTRLTNAKLFYDHYHLYLNQQKALGPYLYNQAQYLLKALLNSKSPVAFQSFKKCILDKFPGNPSLIDLLNRYSKIEHMITGYTTDAAIGSYMRRGSAPSEQNHSSIVSYLGKEFTGELIEVLLALLERHHHKVLKTNEQIASDDNTMILIKFNLKTQRPYSEQLKAASVLNKRGYEQFEKMVSTSNHYLSHQEDDGTYIVYRIGYPDAKRIFKLVDDRCNCSDIVVMQK